MYQSTLRKGQPQCYILLYHCSLYGLSTRSSESSQFGINSVRMERYPHAHEIVQRAPKDAMTGTINANAGLQLVPARTYHLTNRESSHVVVLLFFTHDNSCPADKNLHRTVCDWLSRKAVRSVPREIDRSNHSFLLFTFTTYHMALSQDPQDLRKT